MTFSEDGYFQRQNFYKTREMTKKNYSFLLEIQITKEIAFSSERKTITMSQ